MMLFFGLNVSFAFIKKKNAFKNHVERPIMFPWPINFFVVIAVLIESWHSS